MNYILLNADGSVKKTNFTDSIQQNNDEVNHIFVSVDGLNTSTHDLLGIFVLPDGTVSEESGEVRNNYEYETGETANGYLLTLTINETKLAGLVYLTLQVKQTYTQNTLYTYRAALTINESASLSSVTLITLAQYNALKNYIDTNFALKEQLAKKRIIGAFNTNGFSTGDNDYYSIENVPLNLNDGFIDGAELLIITWGNCFSLCPVPETFYRKREIITYSVEAQDISLEISGDKAIVNAFIQSDKSVNSFINEPDIYSVTASISFIGSDDSYLAINNVVGTIDGSNFNENEVRLNVRFTIPLSTIGFTPTSVDELIPVVYEGVKLGRVVAALWDASGQSKTTRLKYELKSGCTLLDISTDASFTPPSNFTAYVQCIKL